MFDCGASERIYAGPRSHVYRACRNADSARVIIKVPTLGRSRAERVRGLQGELTVLQRLSGVAGTVRAHGLVRSEDDVALVLEDRGGLSMRSLGLAGAIDLETYIEVALRMVDTLAGIHASGMIHNDLNPDHVIVMPDRRQIELVGFSRSLGVDKVDGSVVARTAVEPPLERTYTSPEQTGRLNRGIDFRSDYYLLGLTLFELLTGAPPFQSDDPLELVHAHLARTPSDPRESRDAVPETLSQILLKLLAKDADDRYQNPKTLRRDLQGCLNGHAVPSSQGLPRPTRGRLRLPERLYGREAAGEQLARALEHAVRGNTTLVTVSGPGGVGKSTLIRQVLEGVPGRGGLVISGKFESSQTPYAGLRQALESLLGAAGDDLGDGPSWEPASRDALGEHSARVLADFYPPLQRLFGRQRELPPLPPRQAGTRLSQSLGRLLTVIATTRRPVCLFLDDLQWAGADSIALLRELWCSELPKSLLIVLAHRVATGDGADPFAALLEGLGPAIERRSLTLGDLSEAVVRELLTEALGIDGAGADAMARLVFARTRGNPYFVRSFLAALHADGVLERSATGWEFDLERASQRSFTDNMVDLLLRRIVELPRPTQEVLEYAALLGARFALDTLDCVAARATAEPLGLALEQELVLPFDGSEFGVAARPSASHDYQFAHERVQQAVLETLQDSARLRLHHEIGRRLLAARAPERSERSLFDIVRHLNHAAPLLDSSLRTELAALNLQAAQAALAHGAGVLALQLAREGCARLGDAGWTEHYALALSLHLTAAEAAFAWADHEAFEQIAKQALSHAQSPVDRVRILRLQGRVYQAQAKAVEALETYRRALAELDITLPGEAESASVLRETAELLAPFDVASLLHLPECTDPGIVLAMELLSKLVFFAYSSASPLLPVVVCRLVTLSVTRGNTSESANGYTFYGRLLSNTQDLDQACRFGQLALDLAQRFPDPAMLSQTYLYANFQVMHWKIPPAELVTNFEKAVEYGLEAGSPLNAAASATTLSICRFWAGDRLPELSRAMAAQRAPMERFRQRLVLQWHDVLAQAIQNLCNAAERPTDLQGPIYDERERLAQNASSPSALFSYYVWKACLCYIFGDAEGALAASDANAGLKPAFMPALWAIPVTYLDCLCLLAAAETAQEPARASLLSRARVECDKLERWVVHNPVAVEPKLQTVRAELARLSGSAADADRLFHEAIALAERMAPLPERAITYELAARFSWAQHDRVTARARMRASQRAYFRWGALAKVRALERQYPELVPQTLSQTAPVQHQSDDPNKFDTLDLLSVVNANRLISSEIKTQALLPRLMSLLIESGGAELGYLLLKRRERWVVEAGQSAGKGTFSLLESIPIDELSARGLPGIAISVVDHVARSTRAVLLDEAWASAEFSRDEHIAEHQTASLLCFPMQRGGELIALIYLENNLARGAFTAGSLAVLEMLSMQAIISLENATLYESLEQKVEERTSQLLEKNDELAGALARVVEVQRQMVSQEKLAELGALAAGIAHEIKNPLNFITNFADVASGLAEEIEEVIRERPGGADPVGGSELGGLVASFRQAAEKIREHGARATGIINGMALHARPGGGQHELVDLNYILSQSLVLAAHGLTKNGFAAQVLTHYDPSIGPVEIMAQDISRVVVNLITNARYSVEQKHRQGKHFIPEIRLTSKDRGNLAEISVRDNGLGVPAPISDRIFLPFFTTKPTGEGTGLGLSISHDIVVRGHHGNITVESVEGEFAEFRIVLPKRQGAGLPPSVSLASGSIAQRSR